MKQKP